MGTLKPRLSEGLPSVWIKSKMVVEAYGSVGAHPLSLACVLAILLRFLCVSSAYFLHQMGSGAVSPSHLRLTCMLCLTADKSTP